LHYWSGDVAPEPLSASLAVTLRLESSLLGCLRGEPPDPFWVGPLDAEAFMDLAAELLTFLSQRDRQGVWTLADHLASVDWWDNHVLGYEAVTALEWQQHLSSRMKLVASLAECLLGPRAPEFFRYRGTRWVGQKRLYPFAILLFQLSTERRGEVLERAQCWPEPIAGYISRASKAMIPRFPHAGRVEPTCRSKREKKVPNRLRFSCKRKRQSTI
jgi:hypothetical protein